ncbi:MAG: hypothetical protein J6A62_00550 [Oscillospiraceae bacterium]|nr:hypothetical protein [Oscillospiraceae bacterium]
MFAIAPVQIVNEGHRIVLNGAVFHYELNNPDLEEDNKKMLEALKEHRDVYGIKTVITDDRIPKTGLYTIDKRQLELWEREYTAESIIDELFFSRFTAMGVVPISEGQA